MSVELDHLVVAAPTLDDGVAWCERTLGITPGPGGTHALMGTHNRLFGLGGAGFARSYVEIIAIDPQAPAPGRPRWFGMDELDLSAGPRLVAVVARTAALEPLVDVLHRVGIDGGRAVAASRDTPAGLLQWRIALRDDGRQSCAGAMPTLIEWGARHPADTMAPSGVALRSLVLRGVPGAVVEVLAWAGVHFDDGPGAAIEVQFDTPRGAVTLTST